MAKPKIQAFETMAGTIIKQLSKRGMQGYYCESSKDALELVKSLVIEGSSIGFGGSETFSETGIKDALEQGNYKMLDRSLASSPAQVRDIYLSHLNCDTFFMSTNAITLSGELVNIDGNSNRLACLLYGPKQVIVLAGMNKVVSDVESAIKRIRTHACPANATRLGCKTPCGATGVCTECHAQDCMCCNIVVTRHNRHEGRIKVILIAEDLGF